MIRQKLIVELLGRFLVLFSAPMLPLVMLALAGEKDDPRPLLYAFLLTVGTGLALVAFTRQERKRAEMSVREALVVVLLFWTTAAVFGSLPFVFSGNFPTLTDALYESVSGLTTTGATILPDVEVLTPSVQLWRHLTHWLGGMGVVLLMIAVLPLIGFGTAQLYRAQFAGSKPEKLKPRFLETARSLWKLYVAFTLAEYTALRIAGMDSFEAIAHSFSTMGTGGFSTRTASVAGFVSPAVEYVIVLFMVVASINFTRHYWLWVERRPRAFFFDIEVRSHLFIIAVATATVMCFLLLDGQRGEPAFRSALFQVTAIVTCTGFATADFEQWRPGAQVLLLALMYIGGNTGSTSGGLKTFRVVLMTRVIHRQLKQLLEKRRVIALRLGGGVVPDEAAADALSLVSLALLFNFAASLLLTATGVDVLTSISAVPSAMSNVGPGLGTVGPAENYGHLPAAAKWILMVTMLAGRLEFYSALVIFTPSFWRR
jgi:trk system potassium uptake protein TrkH